jgi:hypothetical protein
MKPLPRASAPHEDDRWRLTDLEVAQRRNLYAAGRGDAPRRKPRRRWTKVLSKAA